MAQKKKKEEEVDGVRQECVAMCGIQRGCSWVSVPARVDEQGRKDMAGRRSGGVDEKIKM